MLRVVFFSIENLNNKICNNRRIVHLIASVHIVVIRLGSCIKMKLFRFVRNLLRTIGLIAPTNQTEQQRCSFTFKTTFILICMIELTISSILYFLFEAKTLDERSESFYTSLSDISCLIDFIVYILEVPKMVESIENMEKFIKNRKF